MVILDLEFGFGFGLGRFPFFGYSFFFFWFRVSGPNSFFFLTSLFLGSPPFFLLRFYFGFDWFGFFWGGRVVRGMKSVKSVKSSRSISQSINQPDIQSIGQIC